MEGKKDFDKENQGTQQMPHVDDGTGGGEEKKSTVTLFGREFDKKKAVMAGLGGLLAIALIGGGAWYAASQGAEPKEPAPIEQAEKTEQYVIQLGAEADGWVKGESSPVIAHIVNKEEKVDYYHAYDANEPHALDVPDEGEYEVSFISPVDKDGSTYEVPKASKVKAEVEDGKATETDLPFEFKPIAADKTSADTLTGIVKSVGDAVKKGDETLTGAKGTKVIEQVKENAKANPNADKEKVEEESQKAEENVTDTPSGGKENDSDSSSGGDKNDSHDDDKPSKPNGGSDKPSDKPSKPNGGGNDKPSKPNGGGNEKPQHTHDWQAQYKTVHHDAVYQTIHHDAVYQTIHHDAVYDYRSICNQCGADITGNEGAHMKESFLNGGNCESHSTKSVEVSPAWDEQKLVKDAWDEQKLVKEAWDEKVITGYVCSSCGKAK